MARLTFTEKIADAPDFIFEESKGRSESNDAAPDSSKLTGVPIGRRTRRAIEHGLPEPQDGQSHRDVAVGISRNLREAGVQRWIARRLLTDALLHKNSALDPARPWTERDAEQIVASVYRDPAPDQADYLDRDTSRLKLFSLTDAAQAAKKEIAWVVRDLIAAGEKAVIAGPPKSLKTWLALALARTVATGGLFLDEGAWVVEEPRPVLFVQEEGAHQRWALRLLSVFDGSLDAPLLYTHRAGFSLVNAAHVEWVAQQAEQIGAALIVIDPLQRVTPGVKENDASETGPAWDAVHALASRTNAAVVVLHHARKGNSEPTMDSIRGSSRIAGEVDLIIVVRKVERGKIEMYLDGRDLVRSDEDGNLEIAYDADSPHLMRTTGFRVSTPVDRKRTREAVAEVFSGCNTPLTTTEVRTRVVARLGEDRTRQAVTKVLQVLADEGLVRKHASGKGKTTTWEWVDA